MLARRVVGVALGLTLTGAAGATAQHAGHDASHDTPVATERDSVSSSARQSPESHRQADGTNGARAVTRDSHDMWMRSLGGGWRVLGMAQAFPVMTSASAWREDNLLNASGLYATQPAAMLNLGSANSRLVLRTTLNFEAWTQRDGELTFGGWGEGFIDARHPHTLLHEAMVTANWWDLAGGAASISAGKGFAPYGTDDPMGRPGIKYPTNHHLSQVLERWTLNAVYLRNGWGLEAGIFGGGEPYGPYDFSNIESFGDSWSARVSKRLGSAGTADTFGPFAPWEISTSYARVAEKHHGVELTTQLYNAAVRHDQEYRFGRLYALAEVSKSEPEGGNGHYSLLGEALIGVGAEARHQPYARLEYATRPEYERKGAPGTPSFFRYDHDSHEIGATRWIISTVGYGVETSSTPASVRPFVELQHNHVSTERGSIDPRVLFGRRSFWSVSAGARVFLGGGPMRMGGYGVLDPMSAAMRPRAGAVHAPQEH